MHIFRIKQKAKELTRSSSLPLKYRINNRIAKTLMMMSWIYKKQNDYVKTIKFESEAFKSFYSGFLPDEDQENIFTADFLMKCTSYSPYKHYERANTIYEQILGQNSPKFLESLRRIADTKLRKYEYEDNIELYRIDTRSFSEIPDISLSSNDKMGLNYAEAGTFYKYIDNKIEESYSNEGEYEQKYAKSTQNLIWSAYIQIYILRNGSKARPKIGAFSQQIEENWIELHGEFSIFWLNAYLGIVWAAVRNQEVLKAEKYSIKMIEIIEEYINSMGNQYSLVANIHIGVIYFIMKQVSRANSLFKEILQQELEYVDDDKTHLFLEQIYLHFAIMFNSMHQNNSSLAMWKALLKWHKNAFERNSSYISKDYYNIGKWFIELEKNDKASYNVSITSLFKYNIYE